MGRKATYQQLADAIGVGDRSSVKELLAKGMPQHVDGAKAWYAANIVGGSDGESESASDGTPYTRKLIAEALCKEADARTKELKLQEYRGELVERAEVASVLRKVIVAIKNRIEAIADELATLFPPDQRSSIIADVRESIRLALMELGELRDYSGDV